MLAAPPSRFGKEKRLVQGRALLVSGGARIRTQAVGCQSPHPSHHCPLCPQPPEPRRPHPQSVLSSRALEATGTMLRVLVGAVLPAMLLTAPPPINKLALFPDKSAWCEAKNITQIVGHSGCEAKSIQNRWDAGAAGGGAEGRGQEGGRGPGTRPCHHRPGVTGTVTSPPTGRAWDSASATVFPTRSRSLRSRWCTVTPACRPSPCGRS